MHLLKKYLSICFLINTIVGFAQAQPVIEVIIPGGNQNDITNAIETLNGVGTITFVDDVDISEGITIPTGITLNFFTGVKWLINTNETITIQGDILATKYQIFKTNATHPIKINNQDIYPEWFGLCSYQNAIDPNHDDVPIIKKAISATSNSGGTLFFEGSNYSIRSNFITPSNIELKFGNSSKWSVNTVSGNESLIVKGKITASLNPIFNLSETSNFTIFNQDIYPEWFGICEYQRILNFSNPVSSNHIPINDDRTIQKAINAAPYGGQIILGGKFYRINETIDVTRGKLRFSGKQIWYSPFDNPELDDDGPTNNLMVVNEDLDILFHIHANGVSFNGLNFSGYNVHAQHDSNDSTAKKGAAAKGIALNFQRPIVATGRIKDLDTHVQNCSFISFRTCIYGEGTNLKIIDNSFVSSYMGVYLNQAHNDFVSPPNVNPRLRGHVIDRNRFHSIGGFLKDPNLDGSTCIKILGEGHTNEETTVPNWKWTGRGYANHITNNYADNTKTFFEGSLDRTKISGNSITLSSNTAIKAYSGAYGEITNNFIDGSFSWNPHTLYPFTESGATSGDAFPEGHGIHVKYASFLNINNNTITNKRKHGIFIERSKNSSIQNNTIMNWNRQAYVRVKVPPGTNHQNVMTEDIKKYDAIHVACTKKITDPTTGVSLGYNIQNVVSGNHISLPFIPNYTSGVGPNYGEVIARYGIYMGDGDAWGFVKNNFIVSKRMCEAIKIESPSKQCRAMNSSCN